MPQLDRYLFREFAQATFAALVILLMVSLGGLFANVLAQIASGRVPATLMLSQLGLQTVRYLPLILPSSRRARCGWAPGPRRLRPR